MYIEASDDCLKCVCCGSCNSQGCIHNQFCFGCIEKRQRCPVCEELITGWNRIPSKPSVNPLTGLLAIRPTSSCVVSDRELIAELNKEEGRGMNVEEQVQEVPGVDQGADDGNYSSDEDDHGIHWSSDDVFRMGGVRSVLQSSGSKEPETVPSAPAERSVRLCEGNVQKRTPLDAPDPLAGPQQGIDELVRLPKSTRSSVRVQVVGHEESSKQRVEKSLNDLLGVVPPATLKVKLGAKRPLHASSVDSSKKKIGRPRNPSNSATNMEPNSRSTSRRGRVPLKLRD